MGFTDIRFPEDEGRHPWASEEWWFFCGHLRGADGDEYGAAICFFPAHCMSVIVDSTRGLLLHSSIVSGLEFEAATGKLDLAYGRNLLRWDGASGTYLLHYEDVGRGVKTDLACKATKKPLLVDGVGKIREGLLGESYYYAQTRLAVEGKLEHGGGKTRVSGEGWIDRQWGRWDWSGLSGWQWYSVQLDNGVDLTAIRIFHPLTRGITVQSASVSRADGTTEVLSRFSARQTASWRSGATGLSYGVRWEVDSPGSFELQLEAVLDGQEVVGGLWEGQCRVSGTWEGKRVSGRAFVEQSFGRVTGRRAKRIALLAAGKAAQLLGVRSLSRKPGSPDSGRKERR